MLKQQHYTLTNVKKVKSQSTTPLNRSETMVVLLLRPSRFQKEVVSGEDSSANHIVEAFMTCGGVHGICGAVDFTTMA